MEASRGEGVHTPGSSELDDDDPDVATRTSSSASAPSSSTAASEAPTPRVECAKRHDFTASGTTPSHR